MSPGKEIPQALQVPVPVFDSPKGRKVSSGTNTKFPTLQLVSIVSFPITVHCPEECALSSPYITSRWFKTAIRFPPYSSHLQAEQTQSCQLPLVSPVLQPPGAPRNAFHYVYVHHVHPKSDTVPQKESSKHLAEGKNHLPQPTSYTLASTAVDAVDLQDAVQTWSCCPLGLLGLLLQSFFEAPWCSACPAACSVSESGIYICLCWTSRSFCKTISLACLESSEWQPSPPAYWLLPWLGTIPQLLCSPPVEVKVNNHCSSLTHHSSHLLRASSQVGQP